jgi:hypothetical protein
VLIEKQTCWVQHAQVNCLLVVHARHDSGFRFRLVLSIWTSVTLVVHDSSYCWFLIHVEHSLLVTVKVEWWDLVFAIKIPSVVFASFRNFDGTGGLL